MVQASDEGNAYFSADIEALGQPEAGKSHRGFLRRFDDDAPGVAQDDIWRDGEGLPPLRPSPYCRGPDRRLLACRRCGDGGGWWRGG